MRMLSDDTGRRTTLTREMVSGLAETFGRKINLVASILLFAAGSAVCASSHTMTQMIVGRTVQGVGGKGDLSPCYAFRTDSATKTKNHCSQRVDALSFLQEVAYCH